MSAPELLVVRGEPAALADQLERSWRQGRTVALAAPEEQALLAAALPPQQPPAWGPAVVLGTGGSRGARRWCLQPLAHLQAAVDGTAAWLRELALEPARLELFNPLPLQHVSGLMPLLRARAWGAELRWLAPELMRSPPRLLQAASPAAASQALLSLVPTQLQRLLADPAGVRWLRRFALIWVGGAPLPQAVAERCRRLGLPLSPCYGSTETGAMVAALPPQQFLAGVSGCGQPLPHARLRVDPSQGALQIRSASLALGFAAAGRWDPLPLRQGWWVSGDAGRLEPDGLRLLGRLDGAIHSGGETVFPEQLEQRLALEAEAAGLPLEAALLLPRADPEWGERLVALVRPQAGAAATRLLDDLARLSRAWRPAERPCRWLLCPQLAATGDGKWRRHAWQAWLASLEAGQNSDHGDDHPE